MNIEAHNAGFITYVAIFTMSFISISLYGIAYWSNFEK